MNKELLDKYFSGKQCTPEELNLVARFLDKREDIEGYFFEQWRTANGKLRKEESEALWFGIAGQTIGNVTEAPVRKIGTHRRWWAAAAAVLIILLGGGLYWNNNRPVPEIVWNKIENSSKDIKFIKLQDGTQVWLNAHSVLSYNEHRQVKLEGEAFFDVAHDSAHPFTVYTRQLQTTVLGTAFNIRAWREQYKTQVALIRGKVKVKQTTGADSAILLPGQVLNFDSTINRCLVLNNAVREDMTGWVKGKIVLDNTPLSEILQQLEQIYKVHIVYDKHLPVTVKLSGRFQRDKIEDVLKNILFPLDLTYSYDHEKFIIHK